MLSSYPSRREFLQAVAAGGIAAHLPQAVAAAAPAADDPACWAQFLGPRRDNTSLETGLNTDWRALPPKPLWKNPLGAGFSSVSIVEGRLFSQIKRGSRDGVVCLDAMTGKEIWFFDAAPSYVDRQGQGRGPRSTPTYHQGKLYCLFPMGELFCLDAALGKKLWQSDIFKDTGANNPAGAVYYWGMAGSPLIEGDLVIAQPGGNKDNSLVAFHKETGKLLWGAGNDPPGYSSPIVISAAGRRQLVSFTAQAAIGVDPADGKLLWRYPLGNDYDCNCATPLWSDNLLFISAAYGTGCAALQIVPQGQGLAVKEKWRSKILQNQFTTSVIVNGHIYGCHGDLGARLLRCLNLQTGDLKWEDRRPAKCSLLACENHLVVASEQGTVRLIEANPDKYVVKGELDNLLTYKAWAAPALLNRRLYLRDDKQLVCLDMSKG